MGASLVSTTPLTDCAILGFVVADECHHIAASAFFHVINRTPAKYWLGLTATPERRDGLEDLLYH